jgi:hypothetical protein
MFRFTIRDLLWLTVVVAIFTSMWLDRRRINSENAKSQALAAEKTAKLQKEVSLLNQITKALGSSLKKREDELQDSLKRREEVANALRIIRETQLPNAPSPEPPPH